MTGRTYGQFCGIARGLELVGERWALLIVRELLLRPKRYTDLRQGLPRIPTNVLATRLRELEDAGIIQRRLLPRPSSSVVYELTPYGRELEDIVLRLGRWGAKKLDRPEGGEVGWVDPSIRAYHMLFRPHVAGGLVARYEIRMGEFTAHVCVDNEKLDVGFGPPDRADLVIDVRSSITPVMAGDVTPEEAIESGRVHLSGDPKLFDRFIEIFRIPPDEMTD
jgi:DNA-binding HxlR family transcriptional regulator